MTHSRKLVGTSVVQKQLLYTIQNVAYRMIQYDTFNVIIYVLLCNICSNELSTWHVIL